MKQAKRLAVLLLAVVLVMAVFSGVVSASGYNKGQRFAINPTTITQYAWNYINPAAEKTDTNSLYLFYSGNQEMVAVRAMGCTNTSGSGMTNVSYYDSRYVDYYLCEQYEHYRIVSRVREDGFNFCTLGFFPQNFSGSLTGYWHPSLIMKSYIFAPVGAYVE